MHDWWIYCVSRKSSILVVHYKSSPPFWALSCLEKKTVMKAWIDHPKRYREKNRWVWPAKLGSPQNYESYVCDHDVEQKLRVSEERQNQNIKLMLQILPTGKVSLTPKQPSCEKKRCLLRNSKATMRYGNKKIWKNPATSVLKRSQKPKSKMIWKDHSWIIRNLLLWKIQNYVHHDRHHKITTRDVILSSLFSLTWMQLKSMSSLPSFQKVSWTFPSFCATSSN